MKQHWDAKKYHLCIYGAIAIFYFWMAAQIPYTHDDWDWGLDVGLHQLLYATVNSRYAGNFFEVVMTRSEFLKTVIMGSCYFFIPLFLSGIAVSLHPRKDENLALVYFLLCNVLLFTMHRIIWRQVYGWVAGFANFAISAVFMMPWLKELCRVLQPSAPTAKHTPGYMICCTIVSICSQLFLENLAIFHVLLGFFLCIVSYFRSRKIAPLHLLMLLGSILGLVIMFSSSLYDTLFSSGSAINKYRQIPLLQDQPLFSPFVLIVRVAASLFCQLYAQNFTISLAILAAFMLLLSKHKANVSPKSYRFATGINRIILISLVCCFVFSTIIDFLQPERAATYIKLLQLPVSILFFLGVSFELYLIFRHDPSTLFRMCVFWLCPPAAIAPLAVTTESGHRLFFTTNILLIFFLLQLLNHLMQRSGKITDWRTLQALSCALVLCLIFHGVIYAGIGACKREREQIIEQAIHTNETTITLPEFPFSDYLHYDKPMDDARIEYFKEFYHIPGDITVIFAGE